MVGFFVAPFVLFALCFTAVYLFDSPPLWADWQDRETLSDFYDNPSFHENFEAQHFSRSEDFQFLSYSFCSYHHLQKKISDLSRKVSSTGVIAPFAFCLVYVIFSAQRRVFPFGILNWCIPVVVSVFILVFSNKVYARFSLSLWHLPHSLSAATLMSDFQESRTADLCRCCTFVDPKEYPLLFVHIIITRARYLEDIYEEFSFRAKASNIFIGLSFVFLFFVVTRFIH